jgi:hypothetical protein
VHVGVFEAGTGVAEGLGEELVFGLEAVDGEDDMALLLVVGAIAGDVGGDTPVVQLGGGVEEGVVRWRASLQDLEEPGGEDGGDVRREAVEWGVYFSAIRALTRTLASGEPFDLWEVFAAAADPSRLEVDPLWHRDLEVRGAVVVGDVPFRWCVVIPDGLFVNGEGLLQALNAASKCGLVARRFFLAFRDGGAETGDEFSEGVLGNVVEGEECVDRGARGDGISRLNGRGVIGGAPDGRHVVRGSRAGSRFVSDWGVHVKEVLQELVGGVSEDVMGVRSERCVGEVEAFEVSGKRLEVEVEPRVATNAIEGDGVRR